MIVLEGRYNSAIVFCETLEPVAAGQIVHLLDQPFVAGSKIRIMPDAHAGAGCTIGTTMTIADKVVPNLVGVDIGCGMETVLLAERDIDPEELDRFICRSIPSGFAVRNKPHPDLDAIDLARLRCGSEVNLGRARLSIGTLGGGNHFIELDSGREGQLYLVVHSGSRNLGKQTAEHYQKQAAASPACRGVDRSLAYCEGRLLDDYLADMALVQRYADLNRRAIVEDILHGLGLHARERWTTVHNYIDMAAMILRKGAVSAQRGEKLLIPLNMRDGSLVAVGKGQQDWNFSAPHGAGRQMSRKRARQAITIEQYRDSMLGIYSSTVNVSTLDEAAFAYKPPGEIERAITDSVQIVEHIKPLYNFKAAES